MIRQLGLLLVVYAAFVLAASGVGSVPSHVEPRWLLLAAAWALWTQRLAHAVLWAGVCGLLIDVLTGGTMGVGVAVVSCGVSALGWLRRDRRWTSGLAFLLITFMLTAVATAGVTTLHNLLVGAAPLDARRTAIICGGQGALTALWGGGLWCLAWGVSHIGRSVAPPLEWRRSAQ